jgi:hypothetical protein
MSRGKCLLFFLEQKRNERGKCLLFFLEQEMKDKGEVSLVLFRTGKE